MSKGPIYSIPDSSITSSNNIEILFCASTPLPSSLSLYSNIASKASLASNTCESVLSYFFSSILSKSAWFLCRKN